jgi:hypothetical protein
VLVSTSELLRPAGALFLDHHDARSGGVTLAVMTNGLFGHYEFGLRQVERASAALRGCGCGKLERQGHREAEVSSKRSQHWQADREWESRVMKGMALQSIWSRS